MEAKCINCHKIKPVFKRFNGNTKKRWCANGTYTTKDTVWCEECWNNWIIKYQADIEESNRRNQEILNIFTSREG